MPASKGSPLSGVTVVRYIQPYSSSKRSSRAFDARSKASPSTGRFTPAAMKVADGPSSASIARRVPHSMLSAPSSPSMACRTFRSGFPHACAATPVIPEPGEAVEHHIAGTGVVEDEAHDRGMGHLRRVRVRLVEGVALALHHIGRERAGIGSVVVAGTVEVGQPVSDERVGAGGVVRREGHRENVLVATQRAARQAAHLRQVLLQLFAGGLQAGRVGAYITVVIGVEEAGGRRTAPDRWLAHRESSSRGTKRTRSSGEPSASRSSRPTKRFVSSSGVAGAASGNSVFQIPFGDIGRTSKR